MYKALSGALVQMRRLDATAQDLANANTAGYKGDRLAFAEVLARSEPAEDRSGGWVAVSGQRTLLAQGGIEATGNPFNLALEGDGFFVVQTARGERYTRNGSFTMNHDGTLITAQGDILLGESGPLQITEGKIEVARDGTVKSEQGEIGRIRIVRFTDASHVVKEGANLLRAAAENVEDTADTRVIQGSLEQSNVSPVEGMISLISINRQFESYERAMKLMDSATERMISDASR